VTVTSGACTANPASTTVVVNGPATPIGVVASAITSTSVSVTWTPASCAAAYDVYRNSGSGFVKIGSSGTTGYTDSTVAANTSYLYAVKAIDAGAFQSNLSAPDLATTILFTDPTITSESTLVKTVHITELRSAIAAVRTLAGLGSVSYTDPTLTPGVTTPKPAHITELRSALDAARSALSLPAISYTDPTITAGTTVIQAAHVNNLRDGAW
ncbi:MAG TPA: hypothetical protein VJZ00_01905, partial [Thermoanaerobaculia bacterium]|nr:hypothetical protein [Thermoanaerobaculia bacterium]